MEQLQAATNIALDLDDRPVCLVHRLLVTTDPVHSYQNSSLCLEDGEGVHLKMVKGRKLRQQQQPAMHLMVLCKSSVPRASACLTLLAAVARSKQNRMQIGQLTLFHRL